MDGKIRSQKIERLVDPPGKIKFQFGGDVLTLVSLFFFKGCLDAAYFIVSVNIWDYMRLSEIAFNHLKYFESYLLLFVLFIVLPKNKKDIASIVVWLTALLAYVPMLVLYGFMDKDRCFTYGIMFFWILVAGMLKIIPLVKIKSLIKIQANFISYYSFIALLLLVLLLVYFYAGININFDLARVYEIREQFQSFNIPLAGYLFTWLAYVVNPVFLAVFLKRRNWPIIAAIIITQLIIFSATGNKTYLFALPFVVFLYWTVKRKNPFFWFATTFGVLTLAGVFSYLAFGDIWTYTIFARRTLLVPAQLSYFYHDFFSHNPLLYLSGHSFVSWFIDYPYQLAPWYLISKIYLTSRPEVSANNGIFADAYMNFGYLGIIIWASLFSVIIKLISSLAYKKDITVCVAAVALMPIIFTNGTLLTSLITNGVVMSMLLLYLLPREGD